MSKKTAGDIVAKLWKMCDILRDGGVNYQDYVTELTYILFLKMLDETEQHDRVPKEFSWATLSELEGDDLMTAYKQALLSLGTGKDAKGDDIAVDKTVQYIYSNANTSIRKPKDLHTLFTNIGKLDWHDVDKDQFGDMYEGLLQKNANETKSGAGQYFTPRPLIDSIVSLVKPEFGDIIQDPAAGTGGFLIAAHMYIKEQLGEAFYDQPDAKFKEYIEKNFQGFEIVEETHRLALMNLLLHDIQGKLECESTMTNAGKEMENANVILSNPPFGNAKGNITRDDFTYKTGNKQLCFLQHIYRNLQPGGRAAVVLPDSVLFDDNKGTQIREDLMNKCNLHTILRLPTGIFYAQGVKTNVLFFEKGKKSDVSNTKEVWVYDMRTNARSFGKTKPLKREDFAEFEKKYGKKTDGTSKRTDEGEQGRFRKFNFDFIKNRRFNLDISWLKDDSQTSLEDLPAPDELIVEITSELAVVMDSLNDIMQELAGETNAE
jgi:type I restriction enzyme M protein